MSAVTEQPTTSPEPAATRPRGSLFRAEVHRFTSRRFIQVLLALATLGWLGAVVIGLLNFGEPTDADLAAATQQRDEFLAGEREFRQVCEQDAEQAGQPVDQFCGPPLTESDVPVEDFLTTAPFDLASAGEAGAVGFAVAAAVLAFLIGATWIGAEWSTRTIVALLFWVPNRLKVIGTKTGVLALAALTLGVAAQLAWLAMAWLLDALVGSDRGVPDGFWSGLLAAQGRGIVLTVLVGLIGFGLANLVRNTGAALGVGFVYFAVAENALRILEPTTDRWLLSTNSIALVLPGGLELFDLGGGGPSAAEPTTYLVSNLQGGLVVGVFAAVLIGVGTWLFVRRDLH
ncbi:ABC-type transport system involved in multi-copper enzyme maturation, permease component [Blastococcus sp. DSM 46786]|uniref:hypothetical protein n=1 Tax=Blastococcus sp. DSM 46786 TaxID=1798227 RepID=UPI0008C30F74|nr:hypothetical protein [Blastococcus sp. DSM 46786]SEL40642.1 ABC-type transport system involved in multi-copper enzyme maturation, permease component [Blastococcus sp. DSM 46786]